MGKGDHVLKRVTTCRQAEAGAERTVVPPHASRFRRVSAAGDVLDRRGALAIAGDPPQILRHGTPLPLSPTEAMLMTLLIRHGGRCHAEIEAAFRAAGVTPASLDVIVHRIRRKFAAVGASDPIEIRRSWGMILCVEPGALDPTAQEIAFAGDTVAR